MSVDIDAFSIAVVLRNVLQDDPDIKAILSPRAKVIHINRYVNPEAANAPWVGVYVNRRSFVPNTLPKGYKSDIEMTVVTQATASRDSEECTKTLELLNKYVVNSLTNNQSLRASIDKINQIDIAYTYSTSSDRDDLYFQMAIIDIKLEVRGNAR